jgi:translation initiation factor IF-1
VTRADSEKESDELEGVIEAILPKRLYRVRLDNGKTIQAGLGPRMQHGVVRLIAGNRVALDVSSFDPNRGHIRRKL